VRALNILLEPEESEPFPIVPATVVIVAFAVVAGLLLYCKKRKK
jgi:hypothetical protein